MNTRLQQRRIARSLIAALLFMVLNPVFASLLVGPQADGDRVMLCTSTGMRWVRMAAVVVEAEAGTPPTASVARSVTSGSPAPAEEPAQSAGAACPFCLGAGLISGSDPGVPTNFEWPRQAVLSIATPVHGALSSARVILDAPTRGPPRALQLV